MVFSFDNDKHEKLIKQNFDQSKVDEVCSRILESTVEKFSTNTLWPVHKLDSEEILTCGFTDLYFGASGIVWLLDQLGITEISYPEMINQTLKKYLEVDREGKASLFFGEVGIRLMKEKFDPSAENLDRLYELIDSHIESEFNEVLYGNQGTLIAAYYLFLKTNDKRFKVLFDKTKTAVINSWKWNEEYSCYLWTQNFGSECIFLGAAHGTFGNIHALMKCRELLTSEEISLIEDRTIQLLKTFIVKGEDGNINWSSMPSSNITPLVHWCHGAPGVICSVAHFLPENNEIDEILLAAGETIWNAGPLKKGTSLCHGSSGNGMAFLKLFNRFKSDVWLDRAQSFLMHSLEQCLELKKEYGDYRYSLWTGDLGIVLLNKSLLNKSAKLPFFDIF